MRTVIRRPARTRALLVLVTALGFLLTACGSGPSQVNSAAIIGDKSIPLGDVQYEIQWMIDNVPQAQQAKDQGNLDQFSRNAVAARVLHELLAVAQQRENLRVDSGQIQQLVESAGGEEEAAKAVGVPPERLREVARDQLLIEELGRSYLSKLEVDFSAAVITEEQPGNTAEQQAKELARNLAAEPERASELITDASSMPPAQTRQKLTLAESMGADGAGQLAASALFGTPENTAVAFQPSREQAGWMVAFIHERNTNARGGGADAAQQASPEMMYQVGVRMLAPIAEELGVQVSPRYGVWDQVGMTIAPSDDELLGEEFPARKTANSNQ
ncbi:hypothetical protein [Tamaricihabitans halophyticus]|uniref:hypothetical protein n=1 Tax=Tamaricihabitans halophyticus TaxID=1262583 RepID=UPI001046CD62|nr:hypothetical protein [Tamaricihabitans halophyticus]